MSSQADSGKSALEIQDEEDEKQGLKLSLYNRDHEQIGLITMKSIQCKKRTSFLDLISN
jgi:hypothetical protein